MQRWLLVAGLATALGTGSHVAPPQSVQLVGCSAWTPAPAVVLPASQSSGIAAQSRAPQFFFTDLDALRKLLLSATETQAVSLCLPLPSTAGHYLEFAVTRSPVARVPAGFEYTAFKAARVNHPGDFARFTLGPNGLDGLIISPQGISVIEPGTSGTHTVSYRSDLTWETSTVCRTTGNGDIGGNAVESETWPTLSLRIAPYISKNYAEGNGGVSHQTLGRVLTSLNIVSGILENEANIQLRPVLDRSLIDTDVVKTRHASQKFIDDAIGGSNYDIGHRLLGPGSDGVSFSDVCTPETKAHAESHLTGSHLNIELLTHEILHQLGATHTFNASGFDTRRSPSTAFEPGNGSSLLSYAGITGGQPLQVTRRDYHLLPQTIHQIRSGLKRANCPKPQTSVTTNTPPAIAVASTSWAVPAGMPFRLTAKVDDIDGVDDVVTVRWEGDDRGAHEGAVPPLFRARWGGNGPTRSFPAEEFAGFYATPFGDTTPEKSMNLRFTVFARDKSFGVSRENVLVHVRDCGPMTIERPADVRQGGTLSATWTWTTMCEGEAQRSMRVSLLVGAPSNPTELALPGNVTVTQGSLHRTIVLPDFSGPVEARLKLEAIGHIYYAVSPTFTIRPPSS